MKNETSIRIPKKYQKMIKEIYHDSDGYWAYTEKGYFVEGMGCHTIHEDTHKEFLEMMRTIKICNCEECK